jgi:release factor glutamine methyltransferase
MEPRLALAGGPDGLEAIRGIVAAAKPRLAEKGALLLEHGFEQGTAVRALLKENGLLGIFTLRDYAGHERISGGHK